jgi:ribose transport system permease protein
VSAYISSALCASIAGIVLAGYVKTPNRYLGDSYLLPSIAAVVIGGTNLAGGRGRVIGTAIAALFLSQLNALVLAMGAPSATQYISRR